jgi:hypothetical protein
MMALRRVRLGSLCRAYSDLIAPQRRVGKWEEINGVNSYVATPSVEYPKDKAILLLTDVFGPQLVNAQVSFCLKPMYRLRRDLVDDGGCSSWRTISRGMGSR